jgi:hypothetical protein
VLGPPTGKEIAMRKLAALMVTGTALASLTAGAEAGTPATDASGKFTVLDIEIFPPRAGTPARRQGVTIAYHFFAGNRLTGQRIPGNQGVTIRFPGFRNNARLFPKCPLPRNAQELGRNRCSNATRVGGGTVEGDARPQVATPIQARVSIFNGTLRNGNPTLILFATATVGGRPVTSETNYQARPAGGGFNLELLPAPSGAPAGLFSLTRVDITVGRTIRVRRAGRAVAVSLLESPLTCPPRGWALSQTNVFAGGGGTLTARDTQPCVPA